MPWGLLLTMLLPLLQWLLSLLVKLPTSPTPAGPPPEVLPPATRKQLDLALNLVYKIGMEANRVGINMNSPEVQNADLTALPPIEH